MRTPPRRPFTLGDLMIGVAAVAGGMALHRWAETRVDRAIVRQFHGFHFLGRSPVDDWFRLLQYGVASHAMFATTVALIALRWRQPRPSVRRILRQPGAVACLAAAAATPLGLGVGLVQAAAHVPQPDVLLLVENLDLWQVGVRWAGPAVGGVWAALWLSGGWRAERSWVDRLGRVAGWYWFLFWPVGLLLWPILNHYLKLPSSLQPVVFP